ncbi:MAG TPA: hypothetical protein VG815_05775 [Chloroflexota bacterium]|nr:hypothetical protein [Chloroflexota bacterium]
MVILSWDAVAKRFSRDGGAQEAIAEWRAFGGCRVLLRGLLARGSLGGLELFNGRGRDWNNRLGDSGWSFKRRAGGSLLLFLLWRQGSEVTGGVAPGSLRAAAGTNSMDGSIRLGLDVANVFRAAPEAVGDGGCFTEGVGVPALALRAVDVDGGAADPQQARSLAKLFAASDAIDETGGIRPRIYSKGLVLGAASR